MTAKELKELKEDQVRFIWLMDQRHCISNAQYHNGEWIHGWWYGLGGPGGYHMGKGIYETPREAIDAGIMREKYYNVDGSMKTKDQFIKENLAKGK